MSGRVIVSLAALGQWVAAVKFLPESWWYMPLFLASVLCWMLTWLAIWAADVRPRRSPSGKERGE